MAQELIRQIRADFGVDESLFEGIDAASRARIAGVTNNIKRKLSNTLESLSTELYSTDTHFVLEFIQNADDNIYDPSKTPFLRFKVTKGRIRVDCNEEGFKEENIRAICSVGESSKKKTAGRCFIGEKGIGFKSVFKIADIVHISSGPYTFKFDKGEELGMVAPLWDKFPQNELVQQHTQFLLKLSGTQDPTSICQVLCDLDPTLLLFLRKLRSINVQIPDGTDITYLRDDSESLNETIVSLRTQNNSLGTIESKKYFVYRYTTRDLAVEPKREGVLETEIVLAFPVGSDNFENQKVFAFLPLRDCGFKFLIQADFLVPSSREDISTGKWNEKLREAVVEAFISSVHQLLKSNDHHHTWFRFIPNSVPETFLKQIEMEIINRIKNKEFFKGRDGNLFRPAQLRCVPDLFRDSDGQPLLDERFFREYYLSDEYNKEDISYLYRLDLGITEFSYSDFLHSLRRMGSRGSHEWSSKGVGWHESLATVLIDKWENDWTYSGRILRSLPLIPLQNGDWVSSEKTNLYFNKKEPLPTGLDLHLLKFDEAKSTRRKKLFEKLGVKKCNIRGVVEEILKVHRNWRTSGCSRKIDEMIQHAQYLYRTRADKGFPSGAASQLAFMGFDGRLALAEELYIDISSSQFSIATVFGTNNPLVRFIHPDYHLNTTDKDWLDWLSEQTGINTVLRLVLDSTLSPEFKFLLQEKSWREILDVLKYNWTSYNDIPDLSKLKVVSEISTIKVSCTDGTDRELNHTILPSRELQYLGQEFLPLIDFKDSENKDWDFLTEFGVSTKIDLQLYLKVLQAYQEHDYTDIDRVKFIYEQLQFLSNTEEDFSPLRLKFEKFPLVLIKVDAKHPRHSVKKADTKKDDLEKETKAKWIFLSDALWKCPSVIRKQRLGAQYPGLEVLFCTHLRVQNANGDIMVDELLKVVSKGSRVKSLRTGNSKFFEKIFKALSASIDEETPTDWVQRLKGKRIFPVIFPATDPSNPKPPFALLASNAEFFLPDKMELKQKFKSKLPMLDIDVEVVKLILPLINLLKIEDKLLSNAVKERGEPDQDRYHDPKLTAQYKEKAIHFAYCARHSKSLPKLMEDEAKFIERLQNIQVDRMKRIRVTLEVTFNGQKVCEVNEGTAKLIDEDDKKLLVCISDAWCPGNPRLRENRKIAEELNKFIESDGLLIAMILDNENDDIHWWFESKSISRDPFESLKAEPPVNKPIVIPYTPATTANTLSSYKQPPHKAGDSDKKEKQMPQDQPLATESPGTQYSAAPATVPARSIPPTNPNSARPSVNITLTDQASIIYAPHETILENDVQTLHIGRPETAREMPATPTPTYVQILGKTYPMPDQTSANLVIGSFGEEIVFDYLKEKLPNFTCENWTSSLRENAGFPPYLEIGTPDFTYQDAQGVLTRLIAKEMVNDWEGHFPTYYLEVKTTLSENPSFHMSNRQMDLARTLALSETVPKNVYVIMRLRKTEESEYILHPWVDPWRYFFRTIQLPQLQLSTFEGYEVREVGV